MAICNPACVRQSILVCLLLILSVGLYAQSQPFSATTRPLLHPLFTDNMVLQRGILAPVWGWAPPGTKVTVSMNGKTASAVADSQGKWLARIGKFSAGGPYTLTVVGPQTVTLKNVMVGDVWICSGQSNMEMGIQCVNEGQAEVEDANYPNIRLFLEPKETAIAPKDTLSGGQWEVCSPSSIVPPNTWGGFSAAGYFFGRDVYQSTNIPIGLIQCCWSGTPAEAWTSIPVLNTLDDFRPAVSSLEETVADYQAKVAKSTEKVSLPDVLASGNSSRIASLFNGMISPILPFGIKGVIWYQGEANAGRAAQYAKLLPAMIIDWRTRFGVGNFPFLIVQLASYMERLPEPADSTWAEIREVQYRTTKLLPKAGMASAIDIGDADDIHPRNKQEVGRRLSLEALRVAYGKHVVCDGPVYRSMKVEGNRIRLKFANTNGGLTVHGNAGLLGFAVAGADGKFYWADAKIEGKSVVVSSPKVPAPVSVRYAWADNPACTLYNGAGLPAVPFRTDK